MTTLYSALVFVIACYLLDRILFGQDRAPAKAIMASGSNDAVVVAVMGVTGCGKSSFIKKVTGRADVKVGHTLTSETAVVQEYRFSHGGVRYVLVDTPGFDDTYTDNETIAKRVIDWMSNSYRGGMRLNGLVYLHRITDTRMAGSAFENLRMFRELCGEQGLKNVVLTSTFWDTVSKATGEKRQKELEENKQFWSRMIQKGCKTARLDGQRNSCLKILEDIARNNSKVTIQIQKEIVDEGRSLKDTMVARETFLKFKTEMEEKSKRDAEALRQEEQRRMREIEDRNRRERERLAAEMEKKRKAEAERQRLEEERIRKRQAEARAREIAEQNRRLQEMKERQEQIARERTEEEARQRQAEYNARQAYYRNHNCRRQPIRKLFCNKCYSTIKHSSYFHCCFCNYDDYDQCNSCGGCCPVGEHPYMKRYFTSEDDDCIVM